MLFHRPFTADIRPECPLGSALCRIQFWVFLIKGGCELVILHQTVAKALIPFIVVRQNKTTDYFPSVCLLLLSGCDTNVQLATEAGIDAIKAVTLSDKDVHELAARGASFADGKNRIAPPESSYAKRLRRLVGDHIQEGGYNFNYKVYLSPEVNAFAMADGTIRIHSKLMDMMDDGELRFVIGHEMGHVVKKHIRKKIMMAYAGSALRKGIASQENLAGDISRSALGGFVETLLNAQFSQQEEREADDYGLTLISALRKLATLGNNHTFLSSHPAPGKRADRLDDQLSSPEKTDEPSWIEGIFIVIKNLFVRLIQWITSLL